jgi:hypothetical protein
MRAPIVTANPGAASTRRQAHHHVEGALVRVQLAAVLAVGPCKIIGLELRGQSKAAPAAFVAGARPVRRSGN